MRRELWRSGIVALLVTFGWLALAGKDLSWDLINHQFYVPFAWLSGRIGTDLFAAGNQAYQHPLGYLPGFLLATSTLPDWAVGAWLGGLHALCIWPLGVLARSLWPAPEQWTARALGLALAWAAPIFLLTVGSTANDPICALLVLAAVALLWRAVPGRSVLAAWGGAALGAAVAIKISNLIVVPALAAAVGLRWWGGRIDGRAVLAAAGAALVVALALLGPWAWWLWQHYDNPLFPFFNHIFHSPYAPQEPMADLRYLPRSAWDAWTRVFALADVRGYVHTEGTAADLRPAALVVLAVIAALRGLVHRLRMQGGWHLPLRAWAGSDVFTLGVFVALGGAAWLLTSGNSRYAIALFMLAGLLVVRVAQMALPARRAWVSVCALLLGAQVAVHLSDGDRRYSATPWTGRAWLDLQVPPRLQSEPFLHLSLGTPTLAGLAPRLAPTGAFINLMGLQSLPTDGPLGERLHAQLRRWDGRTRLMVMARGSARDEAGMAQRRARLQRIVAPYGLAFDWTDCETIDIRLDPKAAPGANPQAQSCRALRVPIDPALDAERRRADAVFAVVEAQCPRVLGPRPMRSDADLGAWQRRYMNSSARVTLSEKDGVMLSHFRSVQVGWLGSIEDVTAGRGRNACDAWRAMGVKG